MTRKRKTEEGGGASQHHGKMPRMVNGEDVDQSGDVSYESQGNGKEWEVRPGMIMEVKMRNFMCHQVMFTIIYLSHCHSIPF